MLNTSRNIVVKYLNVCKGQGFETEQMFMLQSINKPLAGDKW